MYVLNNLEGKCLWFLVLIVYFVNLCLLLLFLLGFEFENLFENWFVIGI